MQNHCKSTKQTDLGKSVWVGAVFSYNQEQLWASQSAGVIGKAPFVLPESRGRKECLKSFSGRPGTGEEPRTPDPQPRWQGARSPAAPE